MNTSPIFETPYERAGIAVPGLPILPHGTERHPVPGGGSRALKIEKDDEISVLDKEGRQLAEVVFFAPDGSSDASMLGLKGKGEPSGIIRALTSDPSGAKVAVALQKSGFDLAKADPVQFLGGDSRPGDMETFHARCDGLLIVCAAGEAMLPDEQDTLTELIVYIKRANPEDGKQELVAPEPLADTVTDLNIQPGEAKSYEVKAGQYIQVLDVKGRECSDFQAFSRRALDNGLEREIDPTTTRSLMGTLYPAPGIFSKYFRIIQ